MKRPPSGIGQQETTKPPLIFSDEQKDSIAYFFLRLSNIYLSEYRRQLPDIESERMAKRENGKYLCGYSREQINKGCDWVHQQKRNSEDSWQFMDIDRCIGAIKQANAVKASHQIYDKSKALPALPARKEFIDGQIANLKGIVG